MRSLVPLRRGGLWKPRDLMNIREEIDKVFEDFFDWTRESKSLMQSDWTPSVDISETDDDIIVTAEMPGMDQKDIKLMIRDNTLTIKGEKKREEEKKEKNYHRIERSYGCFERSFTLPVNVETDKITATYKNGILNITIPKTEEEKPKEIAINIG